MPLCRPSTFYSSNCTNTVHSPIFYNRWLNRVFSLFSFSFEPGLQHMTVVRRQVSEWVTVPPSPPRPLRVPSPPPPGVVAGGGSAVGSLQNDVDAPSPPASERPSVPSLDSERPSGASLGPPGPPAGLPRACADALPHAPPLALQPRA